MGEKTLSEEDRKVIDAGSVQQFEQAADDGQPAEANPDDPPADPPAEDPPAQPSPEPQTRSIVIDGRMQEVPVEIADSIEAERARVESERQRIEQERQQMTTPNNSETPPAEGESFDDKFWANPGQAVDELVSQRIKQTKEELTAEQRKQQEQEKFWADFYGRYPELKGDSDIVEMVLNRNWSELSRLEVASAMDELAKRSATRIGKTLSSQQPPADKHRTASESATPSGEAPPPKEPASDEPDGSKTLSQLLKDRRAKRQQAG